MNIFKSIILSALIIMLLASADTITESRLVLKEKTEQFYKIHNGITMKSTEEIYTSPAPEEYALMRTKHTEYTTQSGEKFIVHESTDSASLANVLITAKGFNSNNEYSLGEIDAIADIWHTDLNNDGYSEWFIATKTVSSGAYGKVFGYVSNEDKQLSYVEIPELTEKETMGYQYMGHDEFYVIPYYDNFIIREFPLYNENDANASPTGGRAKIHYSLMKQNEKFILTPAEVYYKQPSSWKAIKRKDT